MSSLVSPGVSVTITNESFFIPSTAPTVPMIFIATGANKLQPDGITPASGTYEYNVIRTITSLTQSTQMYGIPNFLTDSSGNPYYGDSRNEYGLFALNQYLGIGNLAYVLRANINLNDTISALQALWGSQISQASYTLANLISSYINSVNASTGAVVSQPGYMLAVSGSEFYSLAVEALQPVFAISSFTNVASSFTPDQTSNPLTVYANGTTQQSTGTFPGLLGMINAVVNSMTGTQIYTGSTATSGLVGFTAQQAVSLLTTAANNYMYTSNFASATSLGSNDAARRANIVTALNALILGNQEILSEQYQYNIVLCPGYYETGNAILSLITTLNNEVFGIIDTPMTMDTAQVVSWASTVARVNSTNVAYYYPHGLATNINGQSVLCASSGIALRTIAYSDSVSYVWFAPAGAQRGQITGINDLGYVTGTLGTATTFVPKHLNLGERNSLYQYFTNINPLVYFQSQGFLVWGQKTSAGQASAMDRINVTRMLAYISRALRTYTLPFVFQPNNQITRDNIVSVINSFLNNIMSQQGLYDFLVVCDSSNNPPSVIQQNELYVDIAVSPTIAAEFIYIPIVVVATGASLSAAVNGTGSTTGSSNSSSNS